MSRHASPRQAPRPVTCPVPRRSVRESVRQPGRQPTRRPRPAAAPSPGLRLRPPVVLGALFLLAAPLAPHLEAQRSSSAPLAWYFPEGTTFDPAVPSPEAFLGYGIGTIHTRHDRIVAYMQELARVSDRVTYQEIGITPGMRVMPVITITTPANHARLEEIRQAHLAAADPATPQAQVPDPAGRPVVVHLGYGVHGNETSSSEVALLQAYWLAAGTSAEVEEALAGGIWHVEPVLNPDGRDRHTHWANMHRSMAMTADPLDREHNEAWPGGRSNHYWFDLNRDWLPLVHPESQARIDFHHAWKPNLVTDYHEMGTNSTYFFEPTKPEGSWNPLIPERLYTELTEVMARYWAESLDRIGALYFTKEVFDNTYPGYGSTYPNFLGGLGLVFEQASARGHVQASTHHGELTFAYTIRNQLRTSLATVTGVMAERERFLRYQREFFVEAVEEARALPRGGWVFGDAGDPGLNRAFLDLLLRHRIRVHALDEGGGPVEAGGVRFEPGTAWVVPVAQPHARLARSIFETTDVYADSVFYDASTWTMSLAYGIPHAELGAGGAATLPLGARVERLPSLEAAGALPEALGGALPEARVSYLLDWRHHFAPRALQYLLARGVRVEVALAPFTARTHAGEHTFSAGSISVPVALNTDRSAQGIPLGGPTALSRTPAELHALVREAAEHAGVPVHAVESGLSLEGIDLGSNNMRAIPHAPRTMMLVGQGISSLEAGQVWHLMDTRVDLPIVKVDRDSFGRVRLEDYDVLILASGNYGFIEGERLDELRRWVRGGGTLVAIRTAAQWAVSQGFAPRVNQALQAREALPTVDPPGRRDYADAGALTGAQRIGGSIYSADLDPTHPLGFGFGGREIAVWRDHEIIFPESANPFSTPVRLTDDPHLSGYISPTSLDRIRGSASVLADGIGGGTTVLLVDNPVFRGYWYGTNRLLLNAVYFGRHIGVPAAP
jgi:hypothetical protein